MSETTSIKFRLAGTESAITADRLLTKSGESHRFEGFPTHVVDGKVKRARVAIEGDPAKVLAGLQWEAILGDEVVPLANGHVHLSSPRKDKNKKDIPGTGGNLTIQASAKVDIEVPAVEVTGEDDNGNPVKAWVLRSRPFIVAVQTTEMKDDEGNHAGYALNAKAYRAPTGRSVEAHGSTEGFALVAKV